MDNISKMFIYGTVRKKGLCMENADLAEDEILDTIYDALEKKGYELELATNYVENNFSVENRQRREQRLIDANNIDWNGFSLTAAFAESVEVVLSHQKEIKPDSKPKNVSRKVEESKRTVERYDPCYSCMFANTVYCDTCHIGKD